MRLRKIGVSLTLLLLVAGATVAATDAFEYQLIGTIKQKDREHFRDALPHVFLEGTKVPFAAQTRADAAGKFTFKNLPADLFTLIVYIPRSGQYKKTVEVSASLADSRKRVFVEVEFHPSLESRALRQVSPLELSIPKKALKEFTKAHEELSRRNAAGAVERLKKAVSIYPDFLEAWNFLGTLAYKSGDLDQAEKYFREALNRDPQYYASMVNLGGILLLQGKIKEAFPLNSSAVQAMPDDALAHSQLGLNYYFLGQLDEAENSLKQAIALDPGHFSFPQIPLSRIYIQRRDFSSALKLMEQFLSLHPDAPQSPTIRKQIEEIQRQMSSY